MRPAAVATLRQELVQLHVGWYPTSTGQHLGFMKRRDSQKDSTPVDYDIKRRVKENPTCGGCRVIHKIGKRGLEQRRVQLQT